MKVIPYASAIGSIMYAMMCTRPDLCLAISMAGRYQSNPGVDHWTAVKNILKYLKRTKDMFLIYGGDKELVVNGYVDASIDVTFYYDLIVTSINEKHILGPFQVFQDVLDRCLVIHSWFTLIPPC